jgi:hypothetical protein
VHAMTLSRVVAVNVIVFVLLLVLCEVTARSIRIAVSCLEARCDWSAAASLRVRTLPAFEPEFIGLSRFDPYLGYAPREGFVRVLSDPTEDWVDALVTIRGDGFRSNGPRGPLPTSTVLVVGDSFTFGDQVSDDETWPACLEATLHRGVDNGGVWLRCGAGAETSAPQAQRKEVRAPRLVNSGRRRFRTRSLELLLRASQAGRRPDYRRAHVGSDPGPTTAGIRIQADPT